MPTESEVAGRLRTHEEVCAERYKNLLERMTRMEKILFGVGGAICFAMLSLVMAMIFAKMNIQTSIDAFMR